MSDKYEIKSSGLKEIIDALDRFAHDDSLYERTGHRLSEALEAGFEGTQIAVPVSRGDYRRPAGALRDSGRVHSGYGLGVWTGEVAYGHEDDRLPYAAWVYYKQLDKGQPTYLDPMDAEVPLMEEIVNEPFDEVFGRTE